MFFPESEAIARKHPDLLRVVTQVDDRLSTISSSAPLRAGDFACAIGEDHNQVESVFELLASERVVLSAEMVECEICHNLMPADAFRQAIDDEDEFDCSGCGQSFSVRSDPIVVYRMTPQSLALPKPVCNTESPVEANEGVANVFQRRGEFWVLSFAGETAYMKETVGIYYISRILANPDRDIPAITLLAARAGIDPAVAAGSSGERLTEDACAAYRKRYLELEEELAKAEGNHDLAQITRLQVERDMLTTELASATGLYGRSRRKDDAGRVRNAVSMAVSRAIDSIGKEHKPLGRHLQGSIASGMVFRYSPEHPIDWLI